jgi:hypothetical protein
MIRKPHSRRSGLSRNLPRASRRLFFQPMTPACQLGLRPHRTGPIQPSVSAWVTGRWRRTSSRTSGGFRACCVTSFAVLRMAAANWGGSIAPSVGRRARIVAAPCPCGEVTDGAFRVLDPRGFYSTSGGLFREPIHTHLVASVSHPWVRAAHWARTNRAQISRLSRARTRTARQLRHRRLISEDNLEAGKVDLDLTGRSGAARLIMRCCPPSTNKTSCPARSAAGQSSAPTMI